MGKRKKKISNTDRWVLLSVAARPGGLDVTEMSQIATDSARRLAEVGLVSGMWTNLRITDRGLKELGFDADTGDIPLHISDWLPFSGTDEVAF